jgi:hypothetical protein
MDEAEFITALSATPEDEATKISDQWMETFFELPDEKVIEGFVKIVKAVDSLPEEEQDKIAKIVAMTWYKSRFPRDTRGFKLFKSAVSSLPEDVGKLYVDMIPIHLLEEIIKTRTFVKENFKMLAELVTTPEIRAIIQHVAYEEGEHANRLKTMLDGLKMSKDIQKNVAPQIGSQS